MSKYIKSALAVLFLLTFTSSLATAIIPIPKGKSKTPVAEAKDSLGRETPKGLVDGFLEAISNEDYKKAAKYLDLGNYSKRKGKRLSKDLQMILDQNGAFKPSKEISTREKGHRKDGLDSNLDNIGYIKKADGKTTNILAKRIKDPEVGNIWKISYETVKIIPKVINTMSLGYLDRVLPNSLIKNKLYGMPIGHLGAILAIILWSLLVSRLLTISVIKILDKIQSKITLNLGEKELATFVWPIRIYITVAISIIAVNLVGASIIARQHFGTAAGIISWLALVWIFWTVIDIATEATKKRLIRKKKRSALSAIVFFKKAGRSILIIIVAVIAVKQMGYDITAGLTALGIGGLALALGAQKTLENFMASLGIILEQPVCVGDYCKVGDTVGTVTEIGMRSTRIQTISQTIVTIPNGEVATAKIENYANRKKFLFRHDIGLRYETSPYQIRYILVKIRELLEKNEHVDKEFIRVRFHKFDSSSLNIDTFTYINATDYSEFLEYQEGIMLDIMNIVEETGSGFAFPSHTLYMGKDAPLSKVKRTAIEKEVKKWKKA